MSLLEAIGGVVGFFVYAYLLYRQNKIMEEQNRIMREQLEQDRGKGSAIPAHPIRKWQRLGSYWPMIVMFVLTAATWSALGLFIHFRKPTVIEKPVEKPVPCPEQTTPGVQPLEPAKPLKRPSSIEQQHNPSQAGVQQNNSGGINVQQATTGENSPIIDSPITVGSVPKRISPRDMTSVTRFLSSAPNRARIKILFDQNSNSKAFAEDLYKAIKNAGWPMEDVGVQGVIIFFAAGNNFQGVELHVRGEPIRPNEQIQIPSTDPLFYIGKAAEMLKLRSSVKRDFDQPEGLVTIQFERDIPD